MHLFLLENRFLVLMDGNIETGPQADSCPVLEMYRPLAEWQDLPRTPLLTSAVLGGG